jgi:hypothetical protein
VTDSEVGRPTGLVGDNVEQPCSVCRGTGVVPAGRPFPCVVCGEYVAEGKGYRTVAMTWQHYRCIPAGTRLAGSQSGGHS